MVWSRTAARGPGPQHSRDGLEASGSHLNFQAPLHAVFCEPGQIIQEQRSGFSRT